LELSGFTKTIFEKEEQKISHSREIVFLPKEVAYGYLFLFIFSIKELFIHRNVSPSLKNIAFLK
jgi:hypothetical protein